MKLLFDEHLAARLAESLADLFPASSHVTAVGLGGAQDGAIWQYAQAHDFVLVTKDADFHRMSALHGPPPKVIWIRTGNCATADIARVLRERVGDITEFVTDPEFGFLALS